MNNIVLLIAYDGTHFFGWQSTAMGPSIEDTLKKVLEKILQENVVLQAASRTDRGVHAEGQVVNFLTSKKLDLNQFVKSCNALLGGPITVLSARQVSLSFHPTLEVESKTYLYRIDSGPIQLPMHRHYAWHVPKKLNLDAMKQALSYLIGEQDFSSFCNYRKDLVYPHKRRTICAIDIKHLRDSYEITITANSFLYKMARNLVGTLVYVGLGKIQADAIPEIIAGKSRPLAGITAPAHGLFLQCVHYRDFHF